MNRPLQCGEMATMDTHPGHTLCLVTHQDVESSSQPFGLAVWKMLMKADVPL